MKDISESTVAGVFNASVAALIGAFVGLLGLRFECEQFVWSVPVWSAVVYGFTGFVSTPDDASESTGSLFTVIAHSISGFLAASGIAAWFPEGNAYNENREDSRRAKRILLVWICGVMLLLFLASRTKC